MNRDDSKSSTSQSLWLQEHPLWNEMPKTKSTDNQALRHTEHMLNPAEKAVISDSVRQVRILNKYLILKSVIYYLPNTGCKWCLWSGHHVMADGCVKQHTDTKRAEIFHILFQLCSKQN